MSTMFDIYVFNKRRGWGAMLARNGHIVDWRCGVLRYGSKWTSILTAMIEALNAVPTGSGATIHMDYKCRWFFQAFATMPKWRRNGWQVVDERARRPLPNSLLWRRLDDAMKRVPVTLAEIHGGRDYHIQQLTRTLARETLAGKTVDEILTVDRLQKFSFGKRCRKPLPANSLRALG